MKGWRWREDSYESVETKCKQRNSLLQSRRYARPRRPISSVDALHMLERARNPMRFVVESSRSSFTVPLRTQHSRTINMDKSLDESITSRGGSDRRPARGAGRGGNSGRSTPTSGRTPYQVSQVALNHVELQTDTFLLPLEASSSVIR